MERNENSTAVSRLAYRLLICQIKLRSLISRVESKENEKEISGGDNKKWGEKDLSVE